MSETEHGHNNATEDEKIDGIVDQMRGDIGQGNVTDIPDALRQRLADAQISVSDSQFDAILSKIS